ncbi:MAG: hypothetical protein UT34_C0002G0121 [candidate division WS6 bacterium GW2011_GWF2_39_15]|uniref:Uncharacterized protein n=1 Tax=candidate division WS6 bacterium GW2011_GWF2_39_15 TaxID=1619100 RepID=A0A0G0MNI8_9BACT|nr:MAG: hypothetical protein UT34_C0002G0121 [candidate division WS6 bacterium GW2011_GWF2_39_15]
MMATLAEVQSEFFTHEETKLERGLPVYNFPWEALYIENWLVKDLDYRSLRALEGYVAIDHDPEDPDPTLRIFRELGTANMGTVADNLENLRDLGDPVIHEWLHRINPEMEDMMLNNCLPHLLIINPAGIMIGNVPDGNHRVLCGLNMVNSGRIDKDHLRLPAYIGQSSYVRWLIVNTKIFYQEKNISMEEKVRLIGSRLKSFIPKVNNDAPRPAWAGTFH